MTETTPLTPRQRGILDFIEVQMRDRGYPPSVREIGEAVGLTSTSTVHAHLGTLQKLGYLRRDPTKPRAIEVRYDSSSGATAERRPT
ncbi:MAG: helix-turn-helix domain-containing protein, partial [Actinobacteria bacterium]|nr:helix-turn-helix domain-containing protein [Actinomycetota bacterium]